MNSYDQSRVINGTWGEVWVNSSYMAEVTSFQAKVTAEYADVNMTRKLGKARKLTGFEGKGTAKFNKVSSFFISLVSDNLKAGKQTTVQIISKLSDPDAIGAERVSINDATLDDLTLADWEAKKNGELEVPFAFTDWTVLDSIADS